MAYVTLFVPEEFLNIPTQGSIQYHPSLLPRLPRAELDQLADHPGRGQDRPVDLLARQRARYRADPAAEEDADQATTTRSARVYFDRLFPMGVEAMIEALDLVKAGKAPQHRAGRSAGDLRELVQVRGREIDWSKPAADLQPDPRLQPGARRLDEVQRQGPADLRQRERCRRKGRRRKPGTVTEITADAIVVACNGGQIAVKRVKPADGPKQKAADFVASSGLKAGTLLG